MNKKVMKGQKIIDYVEKFSRWTPRIGGRYKIRDIHIMLSVEYIKKQGKFTAIQNMVAHM